MITDAILSVLFFLPKLLLDNMEVIDFDISFNETMFNAFADMVTCIDYLLPVNVILICFGVKLAVRVWSLPYAIILRVKSFIPTMGH